LLRCLGRSIAANEAGALDIYEDEIQSDSGWRRAENFGRRGWVVKFRDDGCWLGKPISRSILKADPRFEDAPILKIARAGNPFPVTDEQWRAIISQLSD
jgi:hypothetical protein